MLVVADRLPISKPVEPVAGPTEVTEAAVIVSKVRLWLRLAVVAEVAVAAKFALAVLRMQLPVPAAVARATVMVVSVVV
jgi:Na+-transporting NADH:ubiquinone oxidoreductase subunit NqrB